MTHPVHEILDQIVVLTPEEFRALPTYSVSLPTGTTIGKQWKRASEHVADPAYWSRGEYGAAR